MWEEGFCQLLAYVESHGDARVPGAYAVDGYKLGGWVREQRSAHNKGILDRDRQLRLEKLPGWIWDHFADQWEDGFRRLVDYVERHGDARVPQSYRDLDGYALGVWINTQRSNNSRGTLDSTRKRRLESLPAWTWNASSSV